MNVAVFFCRCGGNVSDKIDPALIEAKCKEWPEVKHYRIVDFACGEDGKEIIEKDLREIKPDRVVIAACSPRDHEETFRKVLQNAGMNQFLMQIVNVREHCAWVTADPKAAVAKATKMIHAAVKRVQLQEPLEKKLLEINQRVLIIGGGVAGLKAALTLAQAGRPVTIVEKSPVIGGLPVRYEEVFPKMECGPCMLEPLLNDILHGNGSENIEILTMSELNDVKGFFGNFNVKIIRRARSVDSHTCIGCGECVNVCPDSAPNDFNYKMDKRKAISFPFPGALPNAPFIDRQVCRRFKGQACQLCLDSCPVPNTVKNDDADAILEREIGAIILAVGSDQLDVKPLKNLGYGTIPGVYNSVEFERILAGNGPTQGTLVTPAGVPPKAIGIFHCVGSLDSRHMDYCSGTCCRVAFKFNHLLHKRFPEAKIYHFYKTISVPGKQESAIYDHARENPNSVFVQYSNIDQLAITQAGGALKVDFPGEAASGAASIDIAVLCQASVPSESTSDLSKLLEVTRDKNGFFEELHGRVDSAKSKVRGIYIAGACQSPMDISQTINQAMATTGYVLSELAQGKKIEIEPVVAEINAEKCSGCRSCIPVCPYKAINFIEKDKVAEINSVLCTGCGTCVSTCPSGCIKGHHFSNEAILAEIDAMLS